MAIDSGAILACFGVAVMGILAIIFFLRKCIPDCRERRKVSKGGRSKDVKIESNVKRKGAKVESNDKRKREVDLESGISGESDSESGSVEKEGKNARVDFLERRQDVQCQGTSRGQQKPDARNVAANDAVGSVNDALETAIVQWENVGSIGVKDEIPESDGKTHPQHTVDKSGQDKKPDIEDISPKAVPQFVTKTDSHETLVSDL